jgi:hypothetical protein
MADLFIYMLPPGFSPRLRLAQFSTNYGSITLYCSTLAFGLATVLGDL